MREMSVTEQRYKAVLAVIADGRTVNEVANEWGVCRPTMHRRLTRYGQHQVDQQVGAGSCHELTVVCSPRRIQ